MMVSVILLSAAAVVLESTHDCRGVDCPVCGLIHSLITVTCGLIIAVMTATGVSVSVKRCATTAVRRFCITPVTEKVRMLN